MDAQVVKYVVIGVVLFGAFAVVPIVLALLAHQQKMSELFAKQNLNASDIEKRLERLERRLETAQFSPPERLSEDSYLHGVPPVPSDVQRTRL